MSDQLPDAGPFRRSARSEFEVAMPSREACRRISRRAQRPSIDADGYLFVLGISTLAAGVVMPFAAIPVSVVLLLLAAILARSFHTATRKYDAVPEERSFYSVRDHGITLEGPSARTFWAWTAVRAIERLDEAVVIEVERQQHLVLPVTGAEGARLAAWLLARLPRRTQPPRGRILLMLAVLYAVLLAAAVTVLPSIVAP